MAKKASGPVQDPELYEKLRNEGNSKQTAARISNKAATTSRSAVGAKGGKSGNYADWTSTSCASVLPRSGSAGGPR